MSEAIQARAELRRTCQDPAITGRLREIGNELIKAQEDRKVLTGQQGAAQREIARLEPQIADHLERKNRMPIRHPGFPDPTLSTKPGDYDSVEHGRVQSFVRPPSGRVS